MFIVINQLITAFKLLIMRKIYLKQVIFQTLTTPMERHLLNKMSKKYYMGSVFTCRTYYSINPEIEILYYL